jgi:hypothetical protein
MKMKWDEMSPRERDALIAEKVMGYEVIDVLKQGITHMDNGTKRWIKNPNYSTKIADAWQVVEKLKQKHDFVTIVWGDGTWGCHIATMLPPNDEWEYDSNEWVADAPTAPEAICKASLLAMGVEIE